MTDPKVTTEFVAFPESKIAAGQQRRKDKEPYMSPHAPKPLPMPQVQSNYTMAEAENRGTPIAPVQTMPPPMSAGAPVVTHAPGQIPVQVPSFSQPTSEHEAVVLSLPSNYAFYDFKALYVRPFRGRNLAKLSRAREEGSTLYTAEAVSSVLSTPEGHTHLAFRLTIPDFYYVLYWLRLNSYTKTSYLHKSMCSNPKHVEDVANGIKLPDSLQYSEIIKKGVLTEKYLETIPDLNDFQLEYPNVSLKPATMHNAIEMTDHPSFVDADWRYSAEKACYIKFNDPEKEARATIADRIAIIDDMSPDDHETILDYEAAVSDYGVTETLSVVCKGCGTKRKDHIVLDAHSFFR